MGIGDIKIWLIILLAMVYVVPLYRLIHSSYIDNTLRWSLAFGALAGHTLVVSICLWKSSWFVLAFYLFVINVLWLMTPWQTSLADFLCMKGMRRADIKQAKELIAHHPELAAAHTTLGDAYIAAERFTEAISAYERAIALDPDHSREERKKLEIAQRQTQQSATPSSHKRSR